MNTHRIARALAEEIHADLHPVQSTALPDLSIYDLIGFGSGVYREDLSPRLYELITGLDLQDKNVFVFSTSGVGLKFDDQRLMRKLSAKGALVTGSFTFRGAFRPGEFTRFKPFHWLAHFAHGHPDNRDLHRAKVFVRKIVKSLNQIERSA